MTSRRFSKTTLRAARFVLAALAASALAACAALPDDAPVLEQLDTETGVTITRLGHPVELYRETFQQDPSGRFAYVGPFETNLMGSRELFLWIAVPAEPLGNALPEFELNGAPVALGTPGRGADFANLHKSPYKIPTPWSAMYYYKIDEDFVKRLADASKLTVRVVEAGKTETGTVKTVFATDAADTRLKDFAAR